MHFRSVRCACSVAELSGSLQQATVFTAFKYEIQIKINNLKSVWFQSMTSPFNHNVIIKCKKLKLTLTLAIRNYVHLRGGVKTSDDERLVEVEHASSGIDH